MVRHVRCSRSTNLIVLDGLDRLCEFSYAKFSMRKADQTIAISQHMVSNCRVYPLWLWPDMHLHERLHVHHRLIRDVCSVCTHLCDFHTVPGCGRHDVVGIPFYRNVGVHWTLTIMACTSLLLTPIPYVLYKYGYVIRRRSKYAVLKI